MVLQRASPYDICIKVISQTLTTTPSSICFYAMSYVLLRLYDV